MAGHHAQLSDWYKGVSTDIFKLCAACNFKPTPNQQAPLLRAVQEGRQAIAVRSGQGPGKCLKLDRKSNLCYNAGMGLRQDITEMLGQNALRVPSMDPETENIEIRDATARRSGKKPCVRLTVDSGQAIEPSTDHTIYTPEGYVPAGDLKPGDLIAMPRRLPEPERTLEITDAEVRYVAAMLCDGAMTSGNCSWSHMPGVVVTQFRKDVESLGGTTAVMPRKSKAVTIGVSGLRPLSSKWGMDCPSKHKRVPAEFYGLNRDHLGEFFNVVFSCDGYVTKDGFEIILASKGFIEDIQTLLLRFGIHSRFRYKRAKHKEDYFDAWRLTITGGENIDHFIAFIGVPFGRIEQTEGMLADQGKTENTNTDIVPIQTRELDEMCEDLNIPSCKGQRTAGISKGDLRPKYRARNTSYWSRQKLKEFNKEIGNKHRHARRADNDIYWVKVKEITDIGVHPVYDLSVPGNENFVVNNLVVHNSKTTGVIALFRLLQAAYSKVIVTAPTMKQCKDVWLEEVRMTLRSADPLMQQLFEVTKTRVIVAGEDDWGVTLVTATRPENAQGFHRKDMTIIVEEASGVSRDIMEQFEGTLSNPNSLILQIGNPNHRDCYFFDSFYVYGDRWSKFAWDAEKTPASNWFDPDRNKRLAKQFGRDSDVYRIRVLGEFPHTDPNCVISAEMFNDSAPTGARGVDRMLKLARINTNGAGARYARQMGLDFARFGGDENVVVRRQGGSIVQWGFWPHTDPNDVVEAAFEWQARAAWRDNQCQYVADAGGMGQGVMHNFHTKHKRLFEFHTQASAFDSQKYGNRMTEAWFSLREQMKEIEHGGGCYFPYDIQMQQQLTTRQYYMDKKGRIVLESKDDYMKRQGASPDRADAVVMAYYPLDIGQGKVVRQGASTQGMYRPKAAAPKTASPSQGHTARVSKRR